MKDEVLIVRPNTLNNKSAKLLGINEQRILFYSIYKIQNNASSVTFTKAELTERFGMELGSFHVISKYLNNLKGHSVSIYNQEIDKIEIINAFSTLYYEQGVFTFKFNPDFLPEINKQKRFLQISMRGIENYTNKYSAYLYEYLKDFMWGDISIKKDIPLKDFRAVFMLEKNVHQENKNFKSRVWEPAMKEINKYTDYHIKITTKGRGAAIRYTIYRIENEDLSKSRKSTTSDSYSCSLGKVIIDLGCRDCMKINKCLFKADEKYFKNIGLYYSDTRFKLNMFMEDIFWSNPYYSLLERIKNKTATQLENSYYNLLIENYNAIKRVASDASILEYDEMEAIKYEREFYKLALENEIRFRKQKD